MRLELGMPFPRVPEFQIIFSEFYGELRKSGTNPKEEVRIESGTLELRNGRARDRTDGMTSGTEKPIHLVNFVYSVSLRCSFQSS